MKPNSTKKALLASLLSLLLCASMLVGATFAWFTDTASTAVNSIQAGTLKVELWKGDSDESLGSEALKWVAADGRAQDEILWEPGATYSLESFRIKNAGNLALKYKVVINGLVGSAKLLEAIDFTVAVEGDALVAKDGTSTVTTAATLNNFEGKLGAGAVTGKITITGHMKEDAGNEYMNEKIEGISITVVTTQDTVEKDGIDNTYDTDATYLNTDAEGNILISNADELVYFAKTVNVDRANYSGKTVKLTKNIDLSGKKWISLDTGAAADAFTFDGQGHIISNLNVSGEKNVGFFGTATGMTIRNLTVDGAVVTGINHVAVIAGDALCAMIDNCHVKNAVVTTAVKNHDDGDKAGAIAGYLSAESTAAVTNCSAEACVITGYRDIGGIVGYANAAATITGNTVTDCTITNDQTVNYKNYTSNDEFDANEIVGEYNHGTLDASNTATGVTIQRIVPVTTVEELMNALANAGGDTVLALSAGAYSLSSAGIPAGVTISGAGIGSSTLKVNQTRINQADVILKGMTVEGSGSAGNAGDFNINGNNATLEDIHFTGSGNIAIAVSTGAANNGTVFRNVTILNAFRGIQFWSLSGDNVIENCNLDVAGYPFNIDAAVAGSTLTIKNSTLNGWTSYTNGIRIVTFENCKLGLNTYEFLRPYSETVLTDCEFTSAGYQLNAGGTGAYTITLTNCTKNGTLITAENVKSLLLDMDGWNANATLIVNGVTVTLD